MEIYVARQPIFDAAKSVVAYELLHRNNGDSNLYLSDNDDAATSSVITGSFLTLGLDTLTEGKMAFVNFTSALLESGIPTLLPQEQLGIEVHQDIHDSRKSLEALRQIKAAGYTIAIDDYSLQNQMPGTTTLADIIKINIHAVPLAEQKEILNVFRQKKVRCLAQQVETEQEFDQAFKLGYSLYQGYFFARPTIYSTNTIPVSKLGYIQLIRAINDERPDFKNIIMAIENDVAMSLETIKLVNSAYFARRYKIYSVKQAIITLGIDGVKKWVTLSTLTKLSKNKPDALVSTSLIRSRFMDQIARKLDLARRSSEFSMLGLFSLLDAMTNCPFDSILKNLNISEEIKDILTADHQGVMQSAYKLMLFYERGRWDEAEEQAKSLGLNMADVAETYVDSLRWYNDHIWMNRAMDHPSQQ